MTRQDAVWHANHVFNLVIERCINAQNLKEAREFDEAKQIVIEALEQEPIIYCKDCKYCDINITISKSVTGEVIDVNECIRFHKYVDEDDYCSFAERKE